MKDSRRVLYYVAYPQRMAGANRMLHSLVTNLPAHLEPVVVVSGPGRVERAYREAGIETHVVEPGPDLRQFGKSMFDWSLPQRTRVALTELLPYGLRLARLFERLRIDLVHVNDPRGALLAGAAARLTQRPVVAHLHGEIHPYGKLAGTVFELSASWIVAVCDAIREGLSAKANARCTTVYCGIDDVATATSEPWPHLEQLRGRGVLVIGCMATVAPFKGHHHLLDAVAELNRRGWKERLHVACAGDISAEFGEYPEFLRRKQRDSGLDNVEFLGWQEHPLNCYRSFDVAVLPSVESENLRLGEHELKIRSGEGVPITNLEAMCFELPVVTSAVAGVAEQVRDGVEGFLVPPSDPLALADALERLLLDPALRLRMGAAGRQRVLGTFSTQAYVQGVVGVYDSLERRAPTPAAAPL